MKTNYTLFGVGIVLAAVVAVAIIPGLDFLAWYSLHPVDYWQRVVLVGIELFTAVPRGIFAFLIAVGIVKIAAEMS